MMNRAILFIALWLVSFATQAATLRGTVADAQSGESLVRATVRLGKTKFGATVGLNGSYLIKDIPAGTYTLVVQYVGFKVIKRSVTLKEGAGVVVQDVKLTKTTGDLAEVVITGQAERESKVSTRITEQKADNVLNIIGTKTISLLPGGYRCRTFPTVTPGVSVVRNATGDGQFAITRGMDRRYNYTLVNGIEIPSPDNKNRYVPMDIFPADLLERLEVIKAHFSVVKPGAAFLTRLQTFCPPIMQISVCP